jgi:hypothetical protein
LINIGLAPLNLFVLLYHIHEGFARFEVRNLVFWDDDRGSLANVVSYLFVVCNNTEGSELPQIDVLSIGQMFLDGFHNGLHHRQYVGFLDARFFVDVSYNLCFGHNAIILRVIFVLKLW